jgi:DNA-binding transcriptional MerR regulator
LLKISEFSHLTQVPAKTLRYYDDIGLLKPLHVDQWTGYRYYSAEQLPRLNRILALKALGLSLEQIGQLLDDDLSAEQIRGMLRLKRSEIQQRLREEQARLDYVEARLRMIEQEGKMSEYEVVLKQVAPVHVASLRGTAADRERIGENLGRMFGELIGYVQQVGGRFTETPPVGIAIYYSMDSELVDMEAAVGVASDVQSGDTVRVSDLPAIPQAASVVHKGALTGLPAAYDALLRWLEANNYTIVGPSREVSLYYEPDADPNRYVTEIQVPVAKRQN